MLKNMITHPEIFARLYWLPCATWYKIAGELSRSSPHLCCYLFFDYFRRKELKTAEKTSLRLLLLIFITLYGRKTNLLRGVEW